MPKKIVSFVSPNFQQGPKEFNAYYLPYSCGILWSYAYQFSEIADNYELGDFIWRRDKIEEAVALLKNSDIVAFSVYIWNRNYSKVLARELKKANPDIFIIWGGPEPPIEKEDIFEQLPFVDICVKLEGEKSFKAILDHFITDKDYTKILGILINNNGKKIDTGESVRIDDLDTIPSPYLTDVFKPLMEKFPEIRWNATLESNRGCPYACTFCDWGSLTYNKVKKFGLERVYQEFEWVGKNQCDFVSLTDANFGIFPERDSLIADKLIAVQKEYNNPKAYTISWAKNQKREVVDIVKKLIYEGGAKIGLNLSVQTMDENVLDIIKRKNLDTNKIEEVFEMCEQYNIPLYTELILGLPGETPESWKNNFYRLFEAGNHTGITIYQAQLLENAEMNLTQRKFYKMEGRVVHDYLVGSYNTHELAEGVEVVISTRDLPRQKMIEAQVFGWFMNTFHINGITNYISRVVRKQGIKYQDFYDKLLTHIKKDEWLSSEINRIEEHYDNWAKYGKIDHVPIQGMEIHGWNLVHSTIINVQSLNKHSHVFNVVEDFLRQNDFGLSESLLNDLIKFQRLFLIDYTDTKNYPKVETFNHDILGYLTEDKDLNSSAKYEFDFPEDKNMSLERFCEQIFFARRRNFGKSWVTKI